LLACAGAELAALWQDAHLLAPGAGGEELYLTDSGSWFVGNMILQAQARDADP
jgi:hypothetical protein